MESPFPIDEKLLEEASKLTGIVGKPQLVREALIALIERESAHRLMNLGGTEPNLVAPPRRRLPEA